MNPERVLEFLIDHAKKEPGIVRVTLFGSRARGDHHDRSDYDFAVEAPGIPDSTWAKWADRAQEHAPTLCGIDLVRIQPTTSQELLEAIRREGKIIYDRQSK